MAKEPKGPGGRPTKYTEEILDKARYYLKNYEECGDVIPSHIGLSLYIEICTSTVYDWASQKEKKPFSDILDQILNKQHQVLITKGLTGEFNSNICKLVLGKHGYHDKQDHTLDIKPMVSFDN